MRWKIYSPARNTNTNFAYLTHLARIMTIQPRVTWQITLAKLCVMTQEHLNKCPTSYLLSFVLWLHRWQFWRQGVFILLPTWTHSLPEFLASFLQCLLSLLFSDKFRMVTVVRSINNVLQIEHFLKEKKYQKLCNWNLKEKAFALQTLIWLSFLHGVFSESLKPFTFYVSCQSTKEQIKLHVFKHSWSKTQKYFPDTKRISLNFPKQKTNATCPVRDRPLKRKIQIHLNSFLTIRHQDFGCGANFKQGPTNKHHRLLTISCLEGVWPKLLSSNTCLCFLPLKWLSR